MNINKIRNEALTEDAKMELIADYIESGDSGINVVQITNMSGTLSDEDYKKLLQANSVILASTQFYYKQYDASTLLRFASAPRLGVNKIIFDYIEIEKSTKAYELKNEQYPAA